MLKAYVYKIEVDGVVRYIGKGTGDRVQRHIAKAKRVNVMREGGAKIRKKRVAGLKAAADRKREAAAAQ